MRAFAVGGIVCALVFAAIPSMASGNREVDPPQLELDRAQREFISPGVSDGEQDVLSVGVSVRPAPDMVIKGYRLSIADSTGKHVRLVKVEAPSTENGFLQRGLRHLGLSEETAVAVPGKIEWDGRFESGSLAADGQYTYSLEVWDDAGSVASVSGIVVVDNMPPDVEVHVEQRVFSPNGDGNMDILLVEQSGSAEALWTAVFRDHSHAVVAQMTWNDEAPHSFSWNGASSAGETLPDGVYSYEIWATDRAGNTTLFRYEGIAIDTTDTPVALSVEHAFFSPNGDGNLDLVVFRLTVPVTTDIEEWSLAIADKQGALRRSYQGGGDHVPQTISFDGKDTIGSVLPEGEYRGHFLVVYVNGNNPRAESPPVMIDLTPPSASVNAFPSVFSPNGDGNLDLMVFNQDTSEEHTWTGIVTDSGGRVVRTLQWRGRADVRATWDGKQAAGDQAADGWYTYTLVSADLAGNSGRSNAVAFEKDTRPTPIRLAVDGVYFSPNFDGRSDRIRLAVEYEVPNGVQAVALSILDWEQRVIRTVQRRAAVSEFVWDGLSDAGRVVFDGEYSAAIKVQYRNGNQEHERAGPIVVDTVYPSVRVSSGNLLFSPDGDGKLDTLRIRQNDASEEQQWTGEIRNQANDTVRRYFWNGKAQDLVWDGRDEQGNRVSDGEYVYVVTSTDHAGNLLEARLPEIIVDTRPTPIGLSIDHSHLSPNRDGRRDAIAFMPSVQVLENVETWDLKVYPEGKEERTVKTFSGTSTIADHIVFDGYDDSGRRLPEGSYRGLFRVHYKTGRSPSARSPAISIDLTSPAAQLTADVVVFSPNGDERRDAVEFTQRATQEEEWVGEIVDVDGTLVRTMRWRTEPKATFVWDGRGDNGKLVPDGFYSYFLYSIDRAENVGRSNVVTVEKDARSTPIGVRTDNEYFSPNGDGTWDSVRIIPELRVADGVEAYSLVIRGASGAVVVHSAGEGAVPSEFEWNGRSAQGILLSDGAFSAELEVNYRNGNRPRAKTAPFFIDKQYPEVTLEADYLLFSPNEDGRRDKVVLKCNSSDEDLWEWEIVDHKGLFVVGGYWKNTAGTVDWDGLDANGNRVWDGTYTFRIRSTDRAGNSAQLELPGLEVDTRATPILVTTTRSGFSPNADGVSDKKNIYLYVGLIDGIRSWALSFVHTEDGVQKEYSGGSEMTFPVNIAWYGQGRNGYAPEGLYYAVFTVEYVKGNKPQERTWNTFRLDVSPPKVDVLIEPTPFSPDGDGVEDGLVVGLSAQDESGIRDWRGDILDPKGNPFISFSGTGSPTEPIMWDGRTPDGELVQAAEDYVLVVTASDSLGNVAVGRSTIPVDVLVIREGERLKIRISSITFAPYAADFGGLTAEEAERNVSTLDRLAEILSKFAGYKIQIEGHAVREQWDDAERAEKEEQEELVPLSRERAEAVKSALVERGIQASRMTTAGLGGQRPLVPHGDLANRWKNRRVEFILVRE